MYRDGRFPRRVRLAKARARGDARLVVPVEVGDGREHDGEGDDRGGSGLNHPAVGLDETGRSLRRVGFR